VSTGTTAPNGPGRHDVRGLLTSVGLPADASAEPAGGATGQLWKVTAPGGPFALRTGSAFTIGRQQAVMEVAGRAELPVPEVLACATRGSEAVLLLSWLPGATVFDAVRTNPADAHRLGVLMGEAQRRLHAVTAPPELSGVADGDGGGWPSSGVPPVEGLPQGNSLLHLDWHGLNLLVDGDRISAVLDWDNARAGHPLLDVARSYTLLTVEPTFATLRPDERELLATLADGWATGYGEAARSIPAPCLAWAGRAMLADLAGRYAATPEALTDLRRWTRAQERGA
jgi:aminoglycoside phosphotransferase (APT) family kinase protein